MVDFEHGEIRDIAPYNLLTPEVKAISFALGEAQRRFQRYTIATHLYAELQKIPESVLDLMALELNTQYYSQGLPRQMKEQLVANTLAWYMHGGTPSVLEEFLEMVLAGGWVREWFTYNGKPYYFRAFALAGENKIPLGYGSEIRKQVLIYKNVRSWLEYLAFVIREEYRADISYGTRVTFRTGFYPRKNIPRLKLDSLWKLDGRRKLYQYAQAFDFQPVRAAFRIGMRMEIGSEIRVTTLNKLDGSWKLNGKRKLNAGTVLL